MANVVAIIPAYNAERTLGRCLEGLGNSTLKPIATIVADDGSTDGTVKIAEQHPCTVLRMPANGGQAKARNHAAAQAPPCDYFCFIDSDVVVRPDTIARLVEIIEQKEDRAAASVVFVPRVENLGFFGLYRNLYVSYKWRLLTGPTTLLNASTAVVKSEVFREVGGFDEHMRAFEDQEFSTKVSARYEVWLDSVAQVVHLRPHTFRSLVHDTMFKGAYGAIYLFRRSWKPSMKDARGLQVLSFPFLELIDIAVGPAILLTLAVTLATAGRYTGLLAGLCGFYWLSRVRLIGYLFSMAGPWFALRSMAYMIVESSVCFAAVVWGLYLLVTGKNS